MTEDEQIDLVALMRLGRGDGTIEEWDDLRRDARPSSAANTATATVYLLGEPLAERSTWPMGSTKFGSDHGIRRCKQPTPVCL